MKGLSAIVKHWEIMWPVLYVSEEVASLFISFKVETIQESFMFEFLCAPYNLTTTLMNSKMAVFSIVCSLDIV